MRWLFTPTLRIAAGLVLLTLSFVLIAYSFGLLPNEEKAALESRARVAESLALQLSVAASRNEIASIKETIDSIVGRSGDILSIALRRANGEIIAESGNHAIHWVATEGGKSTPMQIQMPFYSGGVIWGRTEIAFRPLATSRYGLGLPNTMLGFIAFIGIGCFAGYFFVLKRALRELDPGRVIPERVQAAFDTLTEGVLILDEEERLMLVNRAFAKSVGETPASLFGTRVSELPWFRFETAVVDGEKLPWQVAMRDQTAVTGFLIGIRKSSTEVRRLLVNATRILDGKGVVRGVIATFYDFTALHEKNEQLKYSIQQLHDSQTKIEEQNQELRFLSTCDPLTGCLNRRAFFAEFQSRFEAARSRRESISILMLDLDHFKQVNDRFGHAVGDQVLVGFTEILKRSCREQDLVGRYGGEEFCIVLSTPTEDAMKSFARRICHELGTISPDWMPNGERVTVSIGTASVREDACGMMDLLNRADRALYAAKADGRNRVVHWEDTSEKAMENVACRESELDKVTRPSNTKSLETDHATA